MADENETKPWTDWQESLVDDIDELAATVRKLREGPLHEDVIVVVLQWALPGKWGRDKIRQLLDAIESLPELVRKGKSE